MATGTCKWYTKASRKMMNKEVDWDTDTIKVVLVKATYTFAQDTHEYLDDLTLATHEVTDGNGYTRRAGNASGGYTLLSKTIDDTTTTTVTVYDAADTVWTASGGSIADVAGYIIFADTGTDATSPVLGYAVLDVAQTATDGNTITITWGSDGVLKTDAD